MSNNENRNGSGIEKSLLIHIGLHKTGTSWLQQELFDRYNRGFFPLLPNEKILKSKSGMIGKYSLKRFLQKPTSKFGGRFFIYDADRSYLTSLRFNVDSLISMFKEDFDWQHAGVPVISYERLSGSPEAGGFDSAEIARRLYSVFPQAKIFIVIREQSSAITSTYYKYLKDGGVNSFEKWLTQRKYDGKSPTFSIHYFEYHRLIELYQSIFGRNNVLILPYELFSDNPNEFIGKIGHYAEVKLPGTLSFDTKINVGLNRVVEYHLRMLNMFTHSSSLNGNSALKTKFMRNYIMKFKRSLGKLIPGSASRKLEQKHKAYCASLIDSLFTESNKITSELIDCNLQRYGYK